MAETVLPVLLVAFFLGGLTGLRTLTPITVLVWALYLHDMRLQHSPLFFLHYLAAAIVLTVFAVGELIVDKLPSTPSRLQLPGLVARLVFGAICGIVAGQAWGAHWETSALAGLIGAILGALFGHEIRKGWAHALHWHDLPVAFLEDAIAIGGSILILSRAVFLAY